MIKIPLFGAFQRGTSYVQNMGSQYAHKFWWGLVCATGLPKNQLPTGCNWWCNHMQPVATSLVVVRAKSKSSTTGCGLVASKKGQKTRLDRTLKHYMAAILVAQFICSVALKPYWEMGFWAWQRSWRQIHFQLGMGWSVTCTIMLCLIFLINPSSGYIHWSMDIS